MGYAVGVSGESGSKYPSDAFYLIGRDLHHQWAEAGRLMAAFFFF